MGSVSSTSSYLSNLLQTLTAASPQLSSVLSMPKVQSALAAAPPQDLVELSDQALQFQEVGLLFGDANSAQSAASLSDPLFAGLSPVSSGNAVLQALQAQMTAAVNGAATSSKASTPAAPATSTSD